MTQTITAFFDNRADANAAVAELVAAGVPNTSIRTNPDSDTAPVGNAAGYDVATDDKGFWASLKDLFVPDEDRHVYAEAMHRGSIMVAATVDENYVSKTEDILEQRGTVNLDEREATWRRDGWTTPTTAIGGTQKTGVGATAIGATGVADENLQLVEERLKVGKRQVGSGRVKIRSYVVETPVSEQVKLRTESVRVDKVSVDRELRPGEDPFKERTIEATATSEEAVIAKEARVTGEVRVVKTADDRVETVKDTVRSTKVDVDDQTKAGGLMSDARDR